MWVIAIARKKCGRYDLLNQLYQAAEWSHLSSTCASCEACGSPHARHKKIRKANSDTSFFSFFVDRPIIPQVGEGPGDCEDQGLRLKSEGCKTQTCAKSPEPRIVFISSRPTLHMRSTWRQWRLGAVVFVTDTSTSGRSSGSSDGQDVQGALTHYELSGTYRTESPRLSGASVFKASPAPFSVAIRVLRLCSMGMTEAHSHCAARRPGQEMGLAVPLEDLGSYVEQSDDSQLHRWCPFHAMLSSPELDRNYSDMT